MTRGSARMSDLAEADGRRIAVERAIADLQRHLLPECLPEIPGYEFAVFYRPCDAAGGDFFGFQPFADGRMGFVIADVAGHGAAAAVMMAALRGALAAFRVFGRDRESAAQDINSVIHEIAIPGMFITAFFVSLDPATGMLYCGNCGHPPAIILHADASQDRLSQAGDLPMGIVPRIDPPLMTAALYPGDTLVLYTDGVTEARNAKAEMFGEVRLRAAMARASALTAQGVCSAVVDALHAHTGESTPTDDQCVLVCRRR